MKSPEKDAVEAVDLLRKGLPVEEVALKLKTDEELIKHWKWKSDIIGITKDWEFLKNYAFELFSQGVSVAKVSSRLAIPKSTAQSWRRKVKLSPGRPKNKSTAVRSKTSIDPALYDGYVDVWNKHQEDKEKERKAESDENYTTWLNEKRKSGRKIKTRKIKQKKDSLPAPGRSSWPLLSRKEKALVMIRGGVPRSEVAKYLDYSPRTLLKYQQTAEISGKGGSKTKNDLEEVAIEMSNEGYKKNEIAEILRIKKNTIRTWKKSAGIQLESQILRSSIIREEGLEMIREGVSGAEVSRRLGVHPSTVTKWRRDAGLSGKEGTKYHDVDKENDVIDLLREGRSMHHINKSTGVGKKSILRIKADAEREGYL